MAGTCVESHTGQGIWCYGCGHTGEVGGGWTLHGGTMEQALVDCQQLGDTIGWGPRLDGNYIEAGQVQNKQPQRRVRKRTQGFSGDYYNR